MRRKNTDFRQVYQHDTDWNRKREENKAVDRSVILTKLEQIEAATSDIRRTLLSGDASTGSGLALCTDEALRLFLKSIEKEKKQFCRIANDNGRINLTLLACRLNSSSRLAAADSKRLYGTS